MTYKFIIKKRFRKPKTVVVNAEDETYAYRNIFHDYPKYRILSSEIYTELQQSIDYMNSLPQERY